MDGARHGGGRADLPAEVVIHVGMTKAGSTSIQNSFDIRRAALRERGVLFPQSCLSRRDKADPSRTSGHLNLLRMIERGSEGLLLRECAAARPRRLFLSAENLFLDQADADLARLGGLFANARVRLVAMLRHQMDWLPARWRESVRGRNAETRPLDRFALDMLAAGRLDYAARLDHVAALLGAESVVALDYQRLRQSGALVSTMLGEAGVAPGPGDAADTHRWNVASDTAEGTEAARRLNVGIRNLGNRHRHRVSAVAPPGGDGQPGFPRFAPPARARLEAAIDAANARLAARHLGGAALLRQEKRAGAEPREAVVRRTVRKALGNLPATLGVLTPAGVTGPDLAALCDAWSKARVILHLGGGDLALVAASLTGKPVQAVEGDRDVAWRLQLRADRLDLGGHVVAHAAPGAGGLLEGLEDLRGKGWFREPDLVLAPKNRVDEAALAAVRRILRPGRILRTAVD